jgi:hypothetical protein
MGRTRLLLLVIGALGISCGGGDSTGPNDSVAGTYSLRTVNGSNLPYIVVQIGADKVELTSDILTLSEAGSFTELTTFWTTTNGQVTTSTESDAGSFTLNGTAASFVFNSGTSGTGTISGGTITVALSGFSFVYRK